MSNTASIISKVWSFCDILRDDGVGYGDYLEQLTYLLFLKMADEYSQPPYSRDTGIPSAHDWQNLRTLKGADLETHYIKTLRTLSTQKGMLGQIFTKSQNKIQTPALLYQIVQMVDKESWVRMGADVKGDIYEGLLEKNAEDTKSGAGQYFTPRALIWAMVECVRPAPGKTIADPACGTGGFFLAAYDFLIENHKLNRTQKEFLKLKTFYGNEIVAGTRRMALMNLFLHNIGDLTSDRIISDKDALLASPKDNYDYVLANPPFGKKSSRRSITAKDKLDKNDSKKQSEKRAYNRQDFWTSTANKQLNFVQHICAMLKSEGKAAVVLPDNVLFEGGSGEAIRKALLKKTDLHTILRLPTGLFYKQGVKANVLFFDNKPGAKAAWTKDVWYYDFRTNVHFTLKKSPMRQADLKDFIACYKPEARHKRKETWSEKTPDGRWRKFSYDDIVNRDKTSLDIFWLKDESLTDLDNLPDPDVLATEIVENLEAGLESFREIIATLEQPD